MTTMHSKTLSSTAPQHLSPPVKRVSFRGTPVDLFRAPPPPQPETAPLADKRLAAQAAIPAPSTQGGSSWFAGWFCCFPDNTLIDPEPIPNWSGIGPENQMTLVKDAAHRFLFDGDRLRSLSQGLKALPFFDVQAGVRAKDVEATIEALCLFKRGLETDAAGISRQSVTDLIAMARALATALMRLDKLVKAQGMGAGPLSSMATPLWRSLDVLTNRPVGGAGPALDTPMDLFRSGLSLDIECLQQLLARIPA